MTEEEAPRVKRSRKPALTPQPGMAQPAVNPALGAQFAAEREEAREAEKRLQPKAQKAFWKAVPQR